MSSGSQTTEEGLYGSWVELEGLTAAVSRTESLPGPQDIVSSALQGELERILLEVQLECEKNKTRCNDDENLGNSNTRVEALVVVHSPPQVATTQTSASPRSSSEQDRGDSVTMQEEADRRDTDWVWDWSSRPGSMPPKEFVFQHPKQKGFLSVRKAEVAKKGLFSSKVLLILIPSLLASHLLTLGVGIYIGERLAASTASTL